MKKLAVILLSLMMTFCMSSHAQTSKLYVDTVTIEQGMDTTVDVNLENDDTTHYVAFQCDLFLPDNINLVYDEEKYDGYGLLGTDRFAKSHVLNSNYFEDQKRYIVLITSMKNASFKGTSGPLFKMVMHCDASVKPGLYTGYIRNVIFVYITENADEFEEIPFVIKVVDKSTATGIKEMTASKPANETEKIYDLQGRRVANMIPGNLYIVNGKKVVK